MQLVCVWFYTCNLSINHPPDVKVILRKPGLYSKNVRKQENNK